MPKETYKASVTVSPGDVWLTETPITWPVECDTYLKLGCDLLLHTAYTWLMVKRTS